MVKLTDVRVVMIFLNWGRPGNFLDEIDKYASLGYLKKKYYSFISSFILILSSSSSSHHPTLLNPLPFLLPLLLPSPSSFLLLSS